ncbi:MAG TPA: PorP/SprF family type IX secretion system membrane protein [Saprospiraceae bacterium]|nr:PorP/SprF family type IX secretion system membrane protein [Saprospiraceae bacterium]
MLTAFCVLLSCTIANSQDIHFTLHQMTPLAFNPANTGGFYGTYRISGLYRDQYRSVTGAGAYTTPTFSVDLPIIKGFRDKDWVGVGLFFYNDKSGDAGLTQSAYKISAAYHLALNKKGSTVLAVGYQTGAVGRRIKDQTKLVFEDELSILNGMPNQSADLNLINVDKKGQSFTDQVGGLKLTSKYNKTDEFSIGVALGKIGRPNWSLVKGGGGNYRLDPRLHVQAGMSMLMSKTIRLSPVLSYQRIMKGSQSTFVAQAMVDYLYNEAKNVILMGGLGYRSGQGFGDAIQIMAGAYIKDVKVLLGYDLNVSSLSVASLNQGGLELSAQYIGKVYKRPKPDPVIFCPRF